MKKLILTALVALGALAVQAAPLTYDVTDGKTTYDALSDNAEGAGNGQLIFARFDKSTASQMILTKDDLNGILPKTTEGGITRARIKTISFKINDTSGYGEWSLNMTCYAQNINETSFPLVNNKPQYLPYETTCAAKLNCNVEMQYGAYIAELTLTFDGDGFLYTGESILLTTFTEFENSGWDDTWWEGIYHFDAGHGIACLGETGSQTSLHGQASVSDKYIPFMRFTYEEEVETLGPTVTEGELVQGHPIGTKEACDYSLPSLKLPYNPEYQKATTQSLFLKTQLTGLNSADASSETKANIYSITAFLETSNFYPMSTAPFEVEVYALNTDATSFPKESNKEVWFDFSKGVHGHVAIDCSEPGWKEIFEEYYGDWTVPVTVVFDEPFTYEGESIVLTWVTTSPDYDVYDGAFTQHYAFTPGDGINHSAYAVNDDATTGTITKINNQLPYLEINYKPLTISGGEAKTVVSFANVQYGVTKAADSKGAEANNVYVEFDLEDASDCGSYDIYMGTNQIGHMTGKHGFVNFLTVSDKDQTISVKPNGGENVIGGTPLTIAAADLNALFDGPAVTETVGTMLYGSYDYTATKADLKGAAAVKIATSAPVSAIKPGGNLQIMFHGIGTNGYNDAFEALIPASATSWEIARNPALNDGVISFFQNATTTSIAVQRREPQTAEISGRISLKPAADYVCLSGAAVTEDAPAAASATTATVTVSREAASSYAVNFTAETPVEFDVTLPTGSEKIVMEEDDEYLMFYTTSSATLQYRIEPTAPAEPDINALAEEVPSSYDNTHDWTTADKGYVNISLADNKSTKVFVRTVDTNGNARLTAYREIKADGTTSGVAEIKTDGTDAAEYYNMQGIRVSGELTPGIYIRRSGQTATKVTVK